MSGESFLGLDIGGQSIKGIRLSSRGRVEAEISRPTPATEGAEAVLRALRSAIDELLRGGPVSAVGVGTPGGVDARGTIVGEAANIPGWIGTALGAATEAMAQAPCGVRNDGNLAAYAEWAVRSGRSKALLFVGLGTGIGGGFCEGGRLLGGCDDRALEIGHIVIEPEGRLCACGIRGCSESYAAGPSIGRIASELALGDVPAGDSLMRRASVAYRASALCGRAPAFPDSALAVRARRGERLNARDVYEAYASGDALALAVDDIAAEALARTVAAGMAILAPDWVVFGGGVIEGAPHLQRLVAERVPSHVYGNAWSGCSFGNAMLRHRSGLLGAALYGASRVMPREDVLALAEKVLASEGSADPR